MPINPSYKSAFLKPDNTVSDALKNMLETGFKTVLVVDEHEILLGIVTDWDIRAAFLKGVTVESPVGGIMNTNPGTGPAGLSILEYQDLIIARGNDSLPIVDEAGRAVDLIVLRDLIQKDVLENPMLIMAGGQGKRLWPLTRDIPKPLLPVGKKPVLEHILHHARYQGFQNVWVSTHYKSEQIEDFLRENSPANLDVNIIREENPLGTAGSLKALYREGAEGENRPIFIMNGDILTTLDFQNMLDWHLSNGNKLTLCCRQYTHAVPYGVLDTDGQDVQRIREKPVECYNVNAGIYLVEPDILTYIPDNVHFDMPDLINLLLDKNLKVGAYPISESWIDIGQHADYEKANIDVEQYLGKGSS